METYTLRSSRESRETVRYRIDYRGELNDAPGEEQRNEDERVHREEVREMGGALGNRDGGPDSGRGRFVW